MNDPYDICRNYHRGNEFSEGANKKIHPKKNQVGDRIISLLERSTDGMICEEIEYALDLKHQTASARITELKKAGKLIVVGKRKTRSGCMAGIYKVKNKAPFQASLF